MYCNLSKVDTVAIGKHGGANGILGQGSFGQVKLMSALPKVKNFKATLSNLVVEGTGVVVKTTDLDREGYTQFIQDNESLLVAKYFNAEHDLREEAKGVQLMLSKIPGQVIEDTTIMHMIEKTTSVERKQRTFRFMLEVFGKKFLLYKRMDNNVEVLHNTSHDGYRLLYKCTVTLYAFLCSSLNAGCFHRDIKPVNILYKIQKLKNGDFDYEVRIGDFGLFTDGSVQEYGYAGTPMYMCVYDPIGLADTCSLLSDEDDTRANALSYYDVGLLANETYAYTATLAYLASYMKKNQELTRYLQSKKDGVLRYINKSTAMKPFQYNFVEMAPHPKAVIKYILDDLPKVPVPKIYHPQQPVYANSFIADLAVHEIDRYLKDNRKRGLVVNGIVTVYRPQGTENGLDVYLSVDSPFVYTYLLTLILDGIPRSDSTKKDLADYAFYYDKTKLPYIAPKDNVIPQNTYVKAGMTNEQRVRRRMY